MIDPDQTVAERRAGSGEGRCSEWDLRPFQEHKWGRRNLM